MAGLHSLLMLVVLAIPLASACSKKEPATEGGGPGMSPQEIDRGRQACSQYAERVCACEAAEKSSRGGGNETAEAPPGVEIESCDLARGRPEALELAIRAAKAAKRKPKDRPAVEYNVRSIIRKCVEADLKLDERRCPRSAK